MLWNRIFKIQPWSLMSIHSSCWVKVIQIFKHVRCTFEFHLNIMLSSYIRKKQIEKGPTPQKKRLPINHCRRTLNFHSKIVLKICLSWHESLMWASCVSQNLGMPAIPFNKHIQMLFFFVGNLEGTSRWCAFFWGGTSKVPQTERRLQPRGIMLSSSSNGKPTKYICPKICAKAESRRTWN